ncbi:MAG TPA: asparagine synthase (glutamine-hydrolyzing) [Candidatus Limnocylindrales bacterium]|nr:asparagine synthase (glutamine-hydrolyzing) [Candidatus Limnocylindrales bacterium]
MCGIAGLATRDGLRPDDANLVDRMLRSIAHRGPDDQNMQGDERTLLGSRRLAIIDLAGGRQPQADESGLILATQNGEIYNYIELRQDLEQAGHVFQTDSDTETIVHLYEQHGTGFVQFLRGMFAIAIWDGRTNRLVLARDRLGKKPMYWRLADHRLSYGSELKAILEDGELERVVDREALELFLQYQYVPAPWSILKGVAKLPPASLLIWDGDEPVIERYWTPEYAPKRRRTAAEDAEEGLSIIREAVRLRLRSDVPVGVFLSGGMDSSVVTALMAELSADPVRTYSIGFEDQSFDELPYARAVAQRYGTIHTEEVVRLDAVELLPELADHYDEPFGDSSAVPTFRVAQIAAAELKVVLTGDGGDESFGGYTRYRANNIFTTLDAVPTPVLQAMARAGRVATAPLGKNNKVHRRMAKADKLFGLHPDDRYVRQMTIIDQADRNALLGTKGDATSQYLLNVLRAGPANPLDRMLRADVLTYLPEDLLVKMDRATMANSLEARAPLLDHKLVEFAAQLPADRKISGSNTKALLRTIAKQLMPAEMIDRPKMGFGVPIGGWFRGALGDRFQDFVLAPDAASRDQLDPAAAAHLLREHRSGQANHEHRLWMLLMYELWARTWLRGSSPS